MWYKGEWDNDFKYKVSTQAISDVGKAEDSDMKCLSEGKSFALRKPGRGPQWKR